MATDVSSGWTEAVPLLAREQSLVVEGLSVIASQLPVRIRGIDSDNDAAFINDTLIAYCREQEFEFTRSRPYRSNDQAWIEQKNGAVIRRMAGHGRFSGVVAGQALASLYQSARLYVNFFQPSFKLLSKQRDGAKVKRTFHKPQTPCDRLLGNVHVADDCKTQLHSIKESLDPVELLYRIRECQTALASISGDDADGPGSTSLNQFLSELPKLWERGEVLPTHKSKPRRTRTWRTRADPFASVWSQVLEWLEEQPDATAKSLFKRLQANHPDQFPDGQLRTLQRRVKQWRTIMAKQLVYTCLDDESIEARSIGTSTPRESELQASTAHYAKGRRTSPN